MSADELVWLKRRREIVVRAIAEMEEHAVVAHLDEKMNPDIPGSLAWARGELSRIDARIGKLS